MIKISLYSLFLSSLFIGYSSLASADNLKVYGSLVSVPCKITPSDSDIKVEFDQLIVKELYENKPRIDKKEFVIKLSECNLDITNNFKIKFSGVESPNLKGFLALDQSKFKQDIGIGIESSDGVFLPINKNSSAMELKSNGQNEIKFRSFLKVTDKAIADRIIQMGDFSAKAVFTFDYY